MAIADPVITIMDLLDDNWNASNTSSVTPSIHSGWIDTEANSPQVTVSNLDEGPIFGSDAPFSGIKPDGSGAVQDFNGTVQTNCWSSRELSSTNPKKLCWEFSEEVRRIVDANRLTATDLDFIGFQDRNFIVDTQSEPAIFRMQCFVQFGHKEMP